MEGRNEKKIYGKVNKIEYNKRYEEYVIRDGIKNEMKENNKYNIEI